MPRYYFHVFNDEIMMDADGVLLPNRNAALKAGRKGAAALISDQIIAGRLVNPRHHIDIMDQHGELEERMEFGSFFSCEQGSAETAPSDRGGDKSH